MAKNRCILYTCKALGRTYRILNDVGLFHVQVTYDRRYHKDIAVCASFYDARYAFAMHLYRDVITSTSYS